MVTWPWSPNRASRRAQGTQCSVHTPSAGWSALREDTPGGTDQRFRDQSRHPNTHCTNSHTSPSFPPPFNLNHLLYTARTLLKWIQKHHLHSRCFLENGSASGYPVCRLVTDQWVYRDQWLRNKQALNRDSLHSACLVTVDVVRTLLCVFCWGYASSGCYRVHYI